MLRIAMVFSFLAIFFSTSFEMTTQSAAYARGKRKKNAHKTTFRKVWWIFTTYKCTSCHRSVMESKKQLPPPAGLDLSTKELAYKNLVGVQSSQAKEGIYRVNNEENFDSASRVAYSYLIYKLLGTHTKHETIGGSGSQMPPRQMKNTKHLRLHKVPHHNIRKLIRWIADGSHF